MLGATAAMLAAPEAPLTFLRLRPGSWSTSIPSPTAGPVSSEHLGSLSPSSVIKPSVLSPCLGPPCSFLVNSSAGESREISCSGEVHGQSGGGAKQASSQGPGPREDMQWVGVGVFSAAGCTGWWGAGARSAYVGTGLPCCHCHLGLHCHHWTWVPRRLLWGKAAHLWLPGLPASSSCAGGRQEHTPPPASDTLHLGDRPAHVSSFHVPLASGCGAELH